MTITNISITPFTKKNQPLKGFASMQQGNIKRSLSRAGTPIDNACAESMYNIVKTKFVFGESFSCLS